MQVNAISVLPEMFAALSDYGVSGRALRAGLFDLSLWNPRDYTLDRNRRVDDRPYGGGPGMVMAVEPLEGTLKAIDESVAGRGKVIYLSPQGALFNQKMAETLVATPVLTFISGRYEGIDERFIDAHVDQELSLGDYVLSGGELAAMTVIDALVRLLPGALGHEDSASQDSFSDGLLDYPHYTRPEVVNGVTVPAVLLSGNHRDIDRWRLKQSLGRTWLRRPDLLQRQPLDAEQEALLQEFIAEYESRQRSSSQ